MYKKNSIYSINKKNPDAIVYPFADGVEVHITREDFPSEAEFLAFKALSDEDYRIADNYENNTSKKTVSLDDVAEAAAAVRAWMLLWQDKRNALRNAARKKKWLFSSKES